MAGKISSENSCHGCQLETLHLFWVIMMVAYPRQITVNDFIANLRKRCANPTTATKENWCLATYVSYNNWTDKHTFISRSAGRQLLIFTAMLSFGVSNLHFKSTPVYTVLKLTQAYILYTKKFTCGNMKFVWLCRHSVNIWGILLLLAKRPGNRKTSRNLHWDTWWHLHHFIVHCVLWTLTYADEYTVCRTSPPYIWKLSALAKTTTSPI